MGDIGILLLAAAVAIVLMLIGLWTVLTALWRSVSGQPGARDSAPHVLCPRCGQRNPQSAPQCQFCHRPLEVPERELDDLATVERQLQRFAVSKALDAGLLEQVRLAVCQRRSVLRGEAPASPAVTPAPAISAPTPIREPVVPPTPVVIEAAVLPTIVPEPPKPRPVEPPRATPAPTPVVPPAPVPKRTPVALPTPVSRPPLVPPKPLPPPKPPRKPFWETVAAFLEERNIQWAELIVVFVAGLLIVGASIALVITFWQTIQDKPWLLSGIFVVYSAAVFGLGLGCHSRWKLEATGRGLLIIATLLVPLNFLTMVGFHSWRFEELMLEAISLALFGFLVRQAERVIVPEGRWLPTLGVVGNAAALALAPLVAQEQATGIWLTLVGLVPVGIFVGSLATALFRRPAAEIQAPQANAWFTHLGITTFALLMALGLLIYRGASTAGIEATLNHAALLLVLVASAISAVGLTVMRGASREAALAVHRTIASAVAGFGVLLMLLAVVAAWPQPLALLGVGTVAAAVLVAMAFRYTFPYAHAGAIAAAAVVYTIGYHVALGNLPLVAPAVPGGELVRVALSASTGVGLVGLLALLAAVAGLLKYERQHAIYYLEGCGVVALASLALVTGHALLGTERALPMALGVYALYGVGSLVANRWIRRSQASYLGLGLLAVATLWALRWQTAHLSSVWALTLATEALGLAILAAALQRFVAGRTHTPWNATRSPEERQATVELYRLPVAHLAEMLAGLALALGIWTAWADPVTHSPIPPLTAALLTALALLTAWGYRSAERTIAGSTVLLIGLLHTLVVNYGTWVSQPWLVGFLAHATLAAVAMLLLEMWLHTGRSAPLADELRLVFARPWSEVALVSSVLVLPVFLWSSWHATGAMAGCLWWLSGLWLLLAARNRWPMLVAGGQAAMTVAALATATAWLQRHPFSAGQTLDLSDPRGLQILGIGLALLTLAWLVVRLALRHSPKATELLTPAWSSVDRIVGRAVVLLHLALVTWCLVGPCQSELVLARTAAPTIAAFGPTAWLLVGLLAVMLLGMLWDRWGTAELVSSLLLLATMSALIAGPFTGQLAAASALRWSLSVALLVASVFVWLRGYLGRGARSLRMRLELDAAAPPVARATLLVTLALPVLGLTVLAALLQLTGAAHGGPLATTFFAELGPAISYLIPLLLVIVSLVGFALRESSAGYAFGGGLVVVLTVVLSYPLHVEQFQTAELVTLLQLATSTTAVWAFLWLAARRWVNVWRERSAESASTALMRVQLGMGVLGNAVLLGPAVAWIIGEPYFPSVWTATVGSPLGWLALTLVVAAYFFRTWQLGRPVSSRLAGGVGLTVLAQLACSVEAYVPQIPALGYRTLMLGLAFYALGIVLATWWVASLRTRPKDQGPPQTLIRMASEWVTVAGLAAVLLGLKAAFLCAFLHGSAADLPWAAAAIAVASLAGATMAYWRRAEGWAFAAAPGVNLAASLVVWYFEIRSDRALTGAEWLVLMGQANVIASMAVALVWLAARQRLYQLRDLSIRTSPLLGIQTALGVVGNLALLIPAVISLLLEPAVLPLWLADLAAPSGWIALGLAMAAAVRYLRQVAREKLANVVAATGLGVGVLLACQTTRWPELTLLGPWPAFHVLLGSWTFVALAVLGFGMGSRWFAAKGSGEAGGEPSPHYGEATRSWVAVIAAAVVVLALSHCGDDPTRPWWALGAILGSSFVVGLMGLWQRRAGEVFASALLLNVAAVATWWALATPTAASLAALNLVALAGATLVWSLVERLYRPGLPPLMVDSEALSLPHLTAHAGQVLLALYAGAMLACQASGMGHAPVDRLAVLGLLATAAAALVLLWDRRARFPLAALYATSFSGLVMLVASQGMKPQELVWTAPLALAGFVLLTAITARALPRLPIVWRVLRIPTREGTWSTAWLAGTQAVWMAMATALSVWISLDGGFQTVANPALPWLAGRMVAPLALALHLPASVLLAPWAQWQLRRDWHTGVVILGLLLLCVTGWAWLGPQMAAPWLHRSVILLVAASIMTLVTAVAMPRWLLAESAWTAAARRAAPGLGVCALLSLVAVLAQEVWQGTEMARPASIVVAMSLVGLVVGAITVAVVGRLDPLRLSERGRTAYVYAAEVLVALVAIHLRLTMPEYFQSGLLLKYWMFLVLAVAFAGATLSEFFQRRGVPVLSEPLWRTATLAPIAPAIGFWFFLKPEVSFNLAGASPLLWFFAAAFYGLLARIRRSMGYGLLAAAVFCVGLCVFWHQAGFTVWEHPQLWTIPFALVLLVAEHLNHQYLSPRQSTMLRYVALSCIYFSSSFEYVRTLGESPWLPIVLILLSLAGVLVGLVLQVRSFLYMGTVFLGVVMVTMIKYAAFDRQQSWILPTFCIVLGTGLIPAFALFKKRRAVIVAALERFRTWQR